MFVVSSRDIVFRPENATEIVQYRQKGLMNSGALIHLVVRALSSQLQEQNLSTLAPETEMYKNVWCNSCAPRHLRARTDRM